MKNRSGLLHFSVSHFSVRAETWRLFQPDLKNMRPQFPAHENPFGLRVVGDAVKHSLRVGSLILGQYAGEVEVGFHLSGGRINANDPVAMPDVRPNFPVDIFELIEV